MKDGKNVVVEYTVDDGEFFVEVYLDGKPIGKGKYPIKVSSRTASSYGGFLNTDEICYVVGGIEKLQKCQVNQIVNFQLRTLKSGKDLIVTMKGQEKIKNPNVVKVDDRTYSVNYW